MQAIGADEGDQREGGRYGRKRGIGRGGARAVGEEEEGAAGVLRREGRGRALQND